MKIFEFFSMPRYRAMWNDPVRKVRTLESFGMTEDDGGRDLLSAAKRVTDPELLHHIVRHGKEEMMHGELFRARAAELRAESQLEGGIREDFSDKSTDVLRTREVEVDSHGFYDGSLFDSMGEVAYVAMVHVVERRAMATFDLHMRCLTDDPQTTALFERLATDEKYHISYTGKILERWRNEGREQEVKTALKDARRSTFLGGWKRLGLRCAGGFGRVLLYVTYWTFMLPVGLVSRGRKLPEGWQEPHGERRAKLNIANQY